MVGSEGAVRSLSLVAIVVVLLLGRVAEADDRCFAECFEDCVCVFPCSLDPRCVTTCTNKCLSVTCKHIRFLPQNNIEERKQADAVHYCKLGCASSVCSAIATTLRLDSSAGHVNEEAVKESVKRCDNVCSEICVKRFGAAVVAA